MPVLSFSFKRCIIQDLKQQIPNHAGLRLKKKVMFQLNFFKQSSPVWKRLLKSTSLSVPLSGKKGKKSHNASASCKAEPVECWPPFSCLIRYKDRGKAEPRGSLLKCPQMYYCSPPPNLLHPFDFSDFF